MTGASSGSEKPAEPSGFFGPALVASKASAAPGTSSPAVTAKINVLRMAVIPPVRGYTIALNQEAHPMTNGRKCPRLGRDEFQRHAVDAVAQAGRRRAVVEHVAEMTAAAAAMNLVAHHAEGAVGVFQHRVLDRLVETRPARAAVELGCRIEERQVASGAGESAGAVLVVERAGEGTLGVLLAQHGILLGREQLPPFLRGVGDLEGAGDSLAAAADQAPAEQAGTCRGDGDDAKIDLAPGESHRISPQCRDTLGVRVAGLARAFRLIEAKMSSRHRQFNLRARAFTCA